MFQGTRRRESRIARDHHGGSGQVTTYGELEDRSAALAGHSMIRVCARAM